SLLNLIEPESRNFSDVWMIEVFGNEDFYMANHHIFKFNGERISEFIAEEKVWTFLGQFNGRLIAQNSRPEILEYKNESWQPVTGMPKLPPGFLITGISEFGKDTGLVTTEKHGVFLWIGENLQPFKIKHNLGH